MPLRDDDGAAVARTLADGAALAISNARLLDSLKRELEERKRAEEEASRYKALVQHSSDFIGMADLSGEVLFVNQAGRRLPQASDPSVLRRAGYRVLNATSATSALKVCTQLDERIDLLLTDVVMPKMSGTQQAARFSAARPHARVLYVSGYMDVAVMDLGLEFLRKPFTPDGLLKRVREVLDGKASSSQTHHLRTA